MAKYKKNLTQLDTRFTTDNTHRLQPIAPSVCGALRATPAPGRNHT
jgi:hypothetical protein